MATHDYVIDNSTGANVRADINSVLQAILTNNSSSSAPSTTAAYMFWADTTSGTLKIRNSSDNAWVELLQLDGTLTLEDGSASSPALAARNDLNTGVFFSAADKFNVATGGVERMELGATTIFNESGADVDFRIEGDSNANLFYVDAGNNRIGIGTASPQAELVVRGSTPQVILEPTADNQNCRFQFATTDGTIQSSIMGGGSDGAVIKFLQGFTERMRIDSSGRLMINTTTLTQSKTPMLEVKSDSNTSSDFAGVFSSANGNEGMGISYSIIEAFNNAGDAIIQLKTNGTDAVRIADNQNVGIGTTNPGQRLEVRQTSASHAIIACNRPNSDTFAIALGNNSSNNGIISVNATDLLFGEDNAGTFSEFMRLSTNGRLLLGHSSSRSIGGHTALFQQEGTSFSNSTVSITANSADGNGAYIIFGNQRSGSVGGTTIVQANDEAGTIRFTACDGADMNTPAAQIRAAIDGTPGSNDMPGRLTFAVTADGQSAASEVMRIDSNHSIGIGESSPASDFWQSIKFSAHSKGCLRLEVHSFYSSQHALEIINGDDNNARNMADIDFTRNGNQVGSIVLGTGGTTYNTSSDYRLKENIKPIDDGITRLKTLKPSRFNFKVYPEKTVDGFIAHEVTAVPEAVMGEKDEVKTTVYTKDDIIPEGKAIGDIKSTVSPVYQQLDYSKIVPLLTAALQESIAKIEVLETKVAAMEAA